MIETVGPCAQAAETAALVPLTRGCEKLVLVGDQAQCVKLLWL